LEPPPTWAPCDLENPCVELSPPEPEPEPEPAPNAEGPEASCALSPTRSGRVFAWCVALGATLLLLRQRRMPKRIHHR
jgi:hypothetical protein